MIIRARVTRAQCTRAQKKIALYNKNNLEDPGRALWEAILFKILFEDEIKL
jgi:hypothetical protein